MSLGRAWNHDLANKLATASSCGFRGIEIFYEDLQYHARALHPLLSVDTPPSAEHLITAASDIHRICAQFSLDIICLQPFLHFGGILDRDLHAKRIDEMRLWIDLAHCLKTDIIGVPSSLLPSSECSSDVSLIVNDMREISSLGTVANPPIRFVYESVCWGTHSSTWEQSWEVVRLVDRPNFGLCLDTFNIAGRIYGDPSSPTGKTPNADTELEESLTRLRTVVPASKIFLVQLVDAERLSHPLVEGHEWYQPGQTARMTWSRNARLFPFEEERGGYLPVMKIMEVITDVGYSGYISLELFSRTMSEKGEHVVSSHAERAIRSWKKVAAYMGWETPEETQETVKPMQIPSKDECGPDAVGADIAKKDSGIFVSVEDCDIGKDTTTRA